MGEAMDEIHLISTSENICTEAYWAGMPYTHNFVWENTDNEMFDLFMVAVASVCNRSWRRWTTVTHRVSSIEI